MKSLARDLVFVRKGNTIYGISGDDDEIAETKFKNIVMPNFLAKSKSLIKPRPKVGFLTLIARLAFIILRQAFIKTLILHHYDSECHI